jgi:4-deoxy-L-threo-5-hexosulose-uronate ketol-isomerase
MELRYAVHADHARRLDTDALRGAFLVQGLFQAGKLNLVYSYDDRLIVGAAVPAAPIALEAEKSVIGCDTFLERRELGVINIGGPGTVSVDGRPYAMEHRDGLYVGRGTREVSFASGSPEQPGRFYLLSAPAHRDFPTAHIPIRQAQPNRLGSDEQSNRRTIYKYIHPEGVPSCQLVMGLTILEPGNVWNTMPTHLHPRRVEVYLYVDLPRDGVVFHFMGAPDETRHLVVRGEEAVLSPSWSIHSGVGTCAYTFIWGMAGENQAFGDMDGIPMAALR